MTKLNHSCDFCGKADLVVSEAGIVYCYACKKSYGRFLFDKDKGVK